MKLRKKNFWLKFLFGLTFLLITHNARAVDRYLAVEGHFGDWFSDSFNTSYNYGGGFLFRPGIQWLELSLSYNALHLEVPQTDALYPVLHGKNLDMMVFGVTLPTNLKVFTLETILFPFIGYALTNLEHNFSHALELGGGMEFFIWKEMFSLRVELHTLSFFKIPHQGGKTDFQNDLRFLLDVVFTPPWK